MRVLRGHGSNGEPGVFQGFKLLRLRRRNTHDNTSRAGLINHSQAV
jgi:hypothetical protein